MPPFLWKSDFKFILRLVVHLEFQFGTRSLDLSSPRVMGILNVTPDSFSDGGRFFNLDDALFQAERMVMEGAEIIDAGGESTRPGASPVSVEQELERVIPVVERLAAELDVVLSVDTSSPEVMLHAAEAGAGLINDVRALGKEGALQAAASTGLPVCLMHMAGSSPVTMQDNPEYSNVLDEVKGFLVRRVEVCRQSGIRDHQILIDPGFGFGKSVEHNYQLLNQLSQLKDLGFPVLAGLSRKSMIGAVTGEMTPDQRVPGSLAGAVLCVLNGACIVRVHDVKETVAAIKVVSATLGVK